MHLIHRQTQLEDLPSCTALVQQDILGGTADRAELTEMWAYLIENRCAISAVIENRAVKPHAIVGFGLSVCVHEDFATEIRGTTNPYLIRELLQRWKEGHFPVLSLSDIRKGNKNGGLHILGLHTLWGKPGMDDSECAPIRDRMLESLFLSHRGYNIASFMKEIYGEIERERHLTFGFLELNNYGRPNTPSAEARQPYLIGMTREDALNPRLEGRLIRNLFLHHEPVCAFTPADQELLQLALTGLGESNLAEILGISKDSVKSRWDSVYNHIPRHLEHELFLNEEGRLKSRALLNWLRHHPEELRPGLFFKGVDLIGDYSRANPEQPKTLSPQPA